MRNIIVRTEKQYVINYNVVVITSQAMYGCIQEPADAATEIINRAPVNTWVIVKTVVG